MPVSLSAVATFLAATLIFSFGTMGTPHEARAASSEDCPPWERTEFLTNKWLLVNPGGKCYARFTFEIMLPSAEAKPPEVCYFAKVVGSENEYGPFCTGGANFRMDVPGAIEWLKSSKPVRIYIKLCDNQADC